MKQRADGRLLWPCDVPLKPSEVADKHITGQT